MPTKVLLISAMPEGKYEHLRQADEEINGIDEILRPNQSQENFVVERRQHIVRDSLVKLLNKEFDIIHFTGHGDPNGLVFEDETIVTQKPYVTKSMSFEGERQKIRHNAVVERNSQYTYPCYGLTRNCCMISMTE